MTKDQQDKLEQLAKSAFSEPLLEYIAEERKKLDTVKGVKSIEESMAREKAVEILDEIFRFITLKSRPVEEEKGKNEYR
tara:strand:- start:118 stop:354 length:237 start_codon:yes stop_codon:yes gene_type:complete